MYEIKKKSGKNLKKLCKMQTYSKFSSFWAVFLFKKAVYFTNSFLSILSIQEGGLFKRAVYSRGQSYRVSTVYRIKVSFLILRTLAQCCLDSRKIDFYCCQKKYEFGTSHIALCDFFVENSIKQLDGK